MISTVLWLVYDLFLKNDVNVLYLQKVICNKICLLTSWSSLTKIGGSGSASGSVRQRIWIRGSATQNFMDPQHCLAGIPVHPFPTTRSRLGRYCCAIVHATLLYWRNNWMIPLRNDDIWKRLLLADSRLGAWTSDYLFIKTVRLSLPHH